jgi:hypothetical protein
MKKKVIKIEVQTSSLYQIDAEEVAKDRAHYYATTSGDNYDDVYEVELSKAIDDEDMLVNWVYDRNSTDWYKLYPVEVSKEKELNRLSVEDVYADDVEMEEE